MRIIVGISGASGAIYGIRALETLRSLKVETHLVISEAARQTIASETDYALDAVKSLASVVHPVGDIGASIASGSFKTDGMLIAPCSIKTLSAIANCFSANLLVRAADVCLKERRPLVLMLRETPLHTGHLRLMTQASEAGAILLPPVPAFYHRPQSLDEVILQSVSRALDLVGIDAQVSERWSGQARSSKPQRS